MVAQLCLLFQVRSLYSQVDLEKAGFEAVVGEHALEALGHSLSMRLRTGLVVALD